MKRAAALVALAVTTSLGPLACRSSTTSGDAGPVAPASPVDGGPVTPVDAAVPEPPADGGPLPGFSLRAYASPPENPGGLVAFAEAPAGNPARALVVVLHGCTQRASDAASSGWSDAARAYGFAALYPEQTAPNDPTTCFRWFAPEHASRGRGEAASIAALALDAKARLGADHVYVAGLSAGGAMAAALLAGYPELFEAASLQAAIPFGCAKTAFEGAGCASAPKSLSPAQWGDLVRAAAAPSARVRVQLWHGDQDPIVKPANADALVSQWTHVAGIDAVADEETTLGAVTRRAYKDSAGTVRVELGLVRGMGHGAPMATRGADAPCGAPGTYALDVGVCAAASAARFFGLSRLP